MREFESSRTSAYISQYENDSVTVTVKCTRAENFRIMLHPQEQQPHWSQENQGVKDNFVQTN